MWLWTRKRNFAASDFRQSRLGCWGRWVPVAYVGLSSLPVAMAIVLACKRISLGCELFRQLTELLLSAEFKAFL